MKRFALIASIALVLGVAGTGGVNAHLRPAHRGAPVAAQRERHPEMMRALQSLQQAKNELQHSAHDFGGHRVKAIQETDEAIREVREALRFDKH